MLVEIYEKLECIADMVVLSRSARDAWSAICKERVRLVDGIFEIRDEKAIYIGGEIYIAAILDSYDAKEVVIARIPRSLWCWACESDLGPKTGDDDYLSYSMQDYRERRKNEVWRGEK